MKIPGNRILAALLCAALPGASGSLGAQQLPDIGFKSVGRAAPLPEASRACTAMAAIRPSARRSRGSNATKNSASARLPPS